RRLDGEATSPRQPHARGAARTAEAAARASLAARTLERLDRTAPAGIPLEPAPTGGTSLGRSADRTGDGHRARLAAAVARVAGQREDAVRRLARGARVHRVPARR